MAFFDLDFAGQEQLTLTSPGTTITRVDTVLDVSTAPGAVTVGGAAAVNVPNVTNSDTLTDEQEQAAVVFAFDGLSSFDLSFEAGGGVGSGRNFLFAGDFEFVGPTDEIPFPPAPIPLPAAGFLLIGGLGILAMARRRRTAK
ncbi:VPLPA-CTERM sorting domain-containing protein [Actibacterium sp. 188UL27-1]|nr:VPLPA-CTERM sorting domain-containing protein [Actibacterium sp. 188UL27-1]MBM7070226.1 VPLPA-CTERM sorting domain-containing protein [Actibacterium sp. 188UL27-1]